MHIGALYRTRSATRLTLRVVWDVGGEADEGKGNTPMFPSFNHPALELETELEGKMIRLYWRAEKEWCIGKVGVFDTEAKNHKIEYADGYEVDYSFKKLSALALTLTLTLTPTLTLSLTITLTPNP